MKHDSPPDRIVWALEPFAEEVKAQLSAVTAIERLTSPQSVVMPIHVWTGGIPEGMSGGKRSLASQLQQAGQRFIEKFARPKLPQTLERLTLVARPLVGSGESAREVLRFAKRNKATLIVLSRHLRKGAQAWLMGSFAESLALLSDIPILMAPPLWKVKPQAERIFFATDFSPASLEALDRTIALAFRKGLKLTIYHRVEQPAFAASEFTFLAVASWEEGYRSMVKALNAEIEGLADRARRVGVPTETHVDSERRSASAGEAILQKLPRDTLMIAVSAHSGTVARVFMGSTSRFLIRHAEVPVWVVHPRKKHRPQKSPVSPAYRFLFDEGERERKRGTHLLA